MKKEDLIAIGLTEEQAKKVLESLDGNFVTKTRFNEINEENKTLKQSVADRDKQLEDLKKSGGDNAELKKQIEALQQQNSEQKKAHEAELSRLKLDNAIDSALAAAGAKNAKAVKALLDVSKVKLGDDGKLTGWDEQIAAVQNASGDEELSGGSQPQGQTQTKCPQTYNAFDYAKEYQPDETYELKGADSDLAGLDMQKAISDMEKDQVLQQYQYFVGTQDTGVKKTPLDTGISALRSGENFSL